MTILDEIAARTRERIDEKKRRYPLTSIREKAELLSKDPGFPFEQALRSPGMSIICEVKRASPSKGIIDFEFPYLEIAGDYQKAGAAAISCLTEPYYFLGDDRYLEEIAQVVRIPVLRKDFTVDAYMIYEAKLLGASAVLLICAILDDSELREYTALARGLGLSALIEAHTEEEVLRAIKCQPAVIGVNNRDLKTFQVDISTSIRLRSMVPFDYLYISESGIRNAADILALEEAGVNGVLVGETLMRSPDKKQTMEQLKGGGRDEPD